jgi:hypothetical protein
MNPPIDRMKRKTSTEPNGFPWFEGPIMPVPRSRIPYIPLIGASRRSRARPPKSSGAGTNLKEPAIGLPAASSAYWPAGMKNAAIHTRTRRTVRMTTGDGKERWRLRRGLFSASCSSAGPSDTTVPLGMASPYLLGAERIWRACSAVARAFCRFSVLLCRSRVL